MKVAELEGSALNLWVAKASDYFSQKDYLGLLESEQTLQNWNEFDLNNEFSPSTRWADGGPLIEQEYISVQTCMNVETGAVSWEALHPANWICRGATPLIASMRAFVASKFGEEVPDDPT